MEWNAFHISKLSVIGPLWLVVTVTGCFLLLRSGELCRQRWNQMVRVICGHRDKPFIEQVEVLARRYCPEMLPYRKSKAGDLSAEELVGVSDL